MQEKMLKVIVEKNDAGQRLDRFLRKYLRRAPLSGIYRIIRKDLKVNGRRVKEDYKLEAGDELTLYIPEEQVAEFAKATPPRTAKRRFGIAYEDEHLLIADKPAGLLTHGDSREKKNTLANQVMGYLQQTGEYDPSRERTFRPAPVNRLDRNTSGLVVFGKTAEATRLCAELFRSHGSVRKYYLCLVCGELTCEQTIEERLVKDEEQNRVFVADDPAGMRSVSVVRPVTPGQEFSLVEVELLTGRTHQIRVHMAGIGHPLAADPKYGDPKVNARLKKNGMTTQFLHAARLHFDEGLKEIEALEALAGRTIEAAVPDRFEKAKEMLLSKGAGRG